VEKSEKAQPKRHHFVPQFYLRNFADGKRRLRMYARGRGAEPIVAMVKDAAVESGFYSVAHESGEKSQRVESVLSVIDDKAKAAVDAILRGGFPPERQAREDLAIFIALQTLRTPLDRRQYEAMVDYTQKVMLEGWTADYARERLQQTGLDTTDEAVAEIMDVVDNPEKYRFVPHQNEHIKIMLSVATQVAPVIAARAWLLGACNTASFVTSDHPVVWRSAPNETNRHLGVGLGNAEEVYFPLDRHHVLMMALPGELPERRVELPGDAVLFVNHLVAESSHKWTYQQPR